jgi:hypothetical protein
MAHIIFYSLWLVCAGLGDGGRIEHRSRPNGRSVVLECRYGIPKVHRPELSVIRTTPCPTDRIEISADRYHHQDPVMSLKQSFATELSACVDVPSS